MAKNLSPQDVANSWVSGMQGASEKMKRGVAAVTESPMAQAAAAVDLWQQQVSSDATRQKYLRGLGRVSLEEWKNMMATKGIARAASGATAARSKVEQFMADFLPFVNGVAASVRQMPKMTLEDRIARSAEQQRRTAAYRRSR